MQNFFLSFRNQSGFVCLTSHEVGEQHIPQRKEGPKIWMGQMLCMNDADMLNKRDSILPPLHS